MAQLDADKRGLSPIVDAAPVPIYQAAVVADASSASVPATAVRKMTYGVCDLSVANRGSTLRTVPYMMDFLSKDMQLTLSLPSGAHLRQEAVDWLEQADSFAKTVLLAPKHGKLVNFENDPYIQYLPEKGYIGKDRIDLLVEGKDDLGRPIAMTIRFYINVMPRNEIDKIIVNKKTYSKATLKYCGTNKEAWRISYIDTASDAAMVQGGALQSLYTQVANQWLFADLPTATLAQTTGTAITLDTTAAGHGWFLDYTPYLNEEFLPTSRPYVWTARADAEAWGRMDLLTVLLHEVGHAAGLEHDADGLMAATLAPGVRVLPDADELAALQAMLGDSPLLAAHTAPESPTAPRDDAPGLPNSQARGATLIRSARQRPSGLTGLAAADTAANTAPDAGAPRYATAANPTLTNPAFNN